MDITTLRWVLIIAGLGLLAGIFVLGKPKKRSHRSASRKSKGAANRRTEPGERQEPTLDNPDPAPGRFEPLPEADEESPTDQGELPIEPTLEPVEPSESASGAESELTPAAPPKPAGPPPDKIVAMYLQARDNHTVSGLELLDAALKSGMEFGDQGIFHRVIEDEELPVFSMANLTAPGNFDSAAWNTLETKGVTLFMTLPGPMSALDAWDAMMATSRRLGELLHADLLDDSRNVFTRQREGEIREDLRAYERSLRPEG